jgi:membrane-associated phospholipid phosphatase
MVGIGTHKRRTLVTLVFGLLVGALVVFGVLAEEIATSGPIVTLDHDVDDSLHEEATPWVTTVMEGCSRMGSTQALVLVTLLATLALLLRRNWAEAALIAAALAGAKLVDALLKADFHRPRPAFADPVVPLASGYSFPSGHATASMAVYGAVAFILVRHLRSRRTRVAAMVIPALLVTAIGFSRLYLGEHFLSDVLAGYCVGMAWLCVCILALALLTPRFLVRHEGVDRPAPRPR